MRDRAYIVQRLTSMHRIVIAPGEEYLAPDNWHKLLDLARDIEVRAAVRLAEIDAALHYAEQVREEGYEVVLPAFLSRSIEAEE